MIGNVPSRWGLFTAKLCASQILSNSLLAKAPQRLGRFPIISIKGLCIVKNLQLIHSNRLNHELSSELYLLGHTLNELINQAMDLA